MNELFINRLKDIIPEGSFDKVMQSFSMTKDQGIRVNTLKTTVDDVCKVFEERGIHFERVPWCREALTIDPKASLETVFDQGLVYPQSLSSVLVPVVLGPKPGEYILDLCAAPGSKTTHISALMKNEGQIVCVEAIRERMYRLKSVCSLMGAENTEMKLMDGRKFRARGRLFDRVLVDAPCSSEGRFRSDDQKTYAYWSLRKIKEMVDKQRGLLLNASRLLMPGGVLVYSTCTFAPEENEGVVDWLLRKTEGRLKVEKIDMDRVDRYPPILQWSGKEFDPQVQHCLRVLPGQKMEGFFIAKFTA